MRPGCETASVRTVHSRTVQDAAQCDPKRASCTNLDYNHGMEPGEPKTGPAGEGGASLPAPGAPAFPLRPLPPPDSGRFPVYFRALRHRNFRLFWTGQLVSLVGSWMQSAAQWWLVHRLTDQPIWLGIVGTATFLPVFLFSFLGGVMADRLPKRRLIVATQTAAMLLALGLAILTFSGAVRVGHILVFAFLLGTVNAIDMPARQAFVIELVGDEDLMNAVALNSSIFNGARVIGPAIAGLLIAGVGEAVCFLLNGLSFLPVIAGLLAMRLPAHLGRPLRSIRQEIAEGFAFVRQTPRVRAVLTAVAVASIFGMSFTVLLPVFADGILHQGPRGFGILMGAIGMGAVLGALRLAGRTDTRGSSRRIGFGMGAFGAALVGFSFSRDFLLSSVLLLVAGAAMITQLATTNTYLQRTTPDGIRGRVLSIYTFVLVGLAPIGTFSAGAAAQHLGAPWAVRLGGLFCILGALGFARRIPGLRSAAPTPS
jgi:MFS family permease